MMPTALIVHGFMGSPDKDWMRKISIKLNGKGVRVFAPKMPKAPSKSAWLKRITDLVASSKGRLILIGHGLGGVAIMRFLETYNRKAGMVMLFSTPARQNSIIFRSFFKRPFQWKTIKRQSKKFVVVHSKDDPSVKFDNAEELKSKLGAKLIAAEGLGHMHSIWDQEILDKIDAELMKALA